MKLSKLDNLIIDSHTIIKLFVMDVVLWSDFNSNGTWYSVILSFLEFLEHMSKYRMGRVTNTCQKRHLWFDTEWIATSLSTTTSDTTDRGKAYYKCDSTGSTLRHQTMIILFLMSLVITMGIALRILCCGIVIYKDQSHHFKVHGLTDS